MAFLRTRLPLAVRHPARYVDKAVADSLSEWHDSVADAAKTHMREWCRISQRPTRVTSTLCVTILLLCGSRMGQGLVAWYTPFVQYFDYTHELRVCGAVLVPY